MNIAAINTVNYGSTGRIMLGIQKIAEEEGFFYTSYYAIGPSVRINSRQKRIGTVRANVLSSRLAHLTGMMGCFSTFATLKLIAELKRNKIELIHLHNLHVSFLNYSLFFHYIRKNNIKIVWTLHDCWTFTGHCPHFTYPPCDKWKQGCFKCPRYREYPISTFDNSWIMYRLKKSVFSKVADMTLVTPSYWLKSLVKQSFLKEYPVRVIHNGIDLEQFRPIESNFRDRNELRDCFIVLGVAFDWSTKKGLDVFIELSRRLERERFQIVLVGTSEKVDAILPDTIISIHKTADVTELAQLYAAADLFVNPTREEVLGLTNIEANACGTPVLMFNTGGSPECISEKSGLIVEVDDLDSMERHIRALAMNNPFTGEECRAQAKKFSMTEKYSQYISLYREILSDEY